MTVTQPGRPACSAAIKRLIPLLVTLGLIAAPPLAYADRGGIRDAHGDARASWDITLIQVDNRASRMLVRIDYRGALNFGGLGLLVNVGVDLGKPARSVYGADWSIDMLQSRSDPSSTRLQLVRRDNAVRCDGLRKRLRKNAGVVRFSVPQRCFRGDADRVRVAGHSYRPRAAPDQADYVDEWSRWIERG